MKHFLLTLFIGSAICASSQCETDVVASDTMICPGDSVTMTASGPATGLSTTLVGGNNHRGNMFDIVAINTVTIESFDAHPMGNTSYEIYYKVGGYAGSEANAGAWTLLGSAPSVVAQPMGTATPIPIPVNVTIPAGQTYAFYVTSSNVAVAQNYTNGTTVGAVFASDANIQFLEGAGLEYPFTGGGGTFSPRVWNGVIHYSTTPGTTYLWDTGATTAQVGATPSTETTYFVDITPSGCPTVTDSVTIYMNPVPTVDLGLDTSICAGSQITLDAGAGQASYNWNSGASSAQTFDVLAADTVSVEVINSQGCSASDTIIVTEEQAPIVDLGLDTTICEGTTITLDAGNAGSTYDWNTSDTTQTIDVSAGNYTVNVTTAAGCVDSSSVVVDENPAPIVSLGADTTICVYGTTTIDAGTGYAGYLWSTTETTSSVLADGAALGLGTHTFTVQVSDSVGCTSSDDLIITVDACAGINSESVKHIEVYPNPTTNSISVTLDQFISDAKVIVYSTNGVQVLSVEMTSNKQIIDFSELASGTYILELNTSEYQEIVKVIKH